MALRRQRNYILTGIIILAFWSISVALTGGPIQPEYLSFEQIENSNLVNLPTGNMVYNLPLGDVGGPAGVGYPVVLSYHAGIMNEQEATWTGLGWGLNVGSINRMIRGFPDDYNGEPSLTHTHARGGGKDHFISTGGAYYVYLGLTFHWADWGDDQDFGIWGAAAGISYYGTTALSYDKYGNYSLSNNFAGTSWGFTWADGESKPEWYASISLDFGVAGLSLSTNDDPKWSVAGVSFDNFGTTSSNMTSSSKGITLDGSWIGIPVSYSRYTTKWTFDEMTSGSAVGYLYQSPYTPAEVVTENPLLAEVMRNQSGSLWKYVLKDSIGSTPAITKKSQADRVEYAPAGDYSLPSQDIFMVHGQGVGGCFKPISYKSMVTCYSENGEYNGLIGKPKSSSIPGEDPFEFYFNPDQVKISPKYSEGIVFKMLGEASLNLIDNTAGTYTGSKDYTNIDLSGGTAGRTYGTRIEPIFGIDADFKDKLTGFVVTTQEGMTYYYAQPLFSLQNVSLVNNKKVIPENINLCGQTSHSKCMGKKDCECSYQQDFGAYATSWLLTAVTGPDYIKKVWIDPNSDDYYEGEQDIAMENLSPHQGDYGYWVAFRYDYGAPVRIDENGFPYLATDEGTYPKITYPWQYPYKDWYEQPCTGVYSSSFGLKEMTYLKSIETASEVAFFRTSERLDGIGLDFDTEYPRFHNEYVLNEENTSSERIVTPTNDRCLIKKGCDRHRVCKLPSVVPLSTSIIVNSSTLDACYKIIVDDVNYYNEFDFSSIGSGSKIASITFASDVHYKSCNRDESRDNQKATMTIIKDAQGWNVDTGTRKFIAKQNQVGDDIVSTISTNFRDPFLSTLYRNNPLLAGFPDERCKDYCESQSYQTAFARCVYAEKTIDGNGKPVVVLYVLGYDGYYPQQGKDVRTGLRFGQWHFQWKWGWWDVWSYSKPKFSSGRIAASIWDRFRNRNEIIPFMKKLDEVAWYSKAQFPFLNGINDPGAVEAKSSFPWEGLSYPQSYRRVKFRYNYELAKGTPNSINMDDKTRTGGRLTLKEVREEAGPEDASVAMPPYLFEYQTKDDLGADYHYMGFANADAWGFRTPVTGPDPTNSTAGVNWNLKKVLLPSCATVEFKYERDSINSIYGSLYKLSLLSSNKCPSSMSIYPEEGTAGQFYVKKNVSNITDSNITVNDTLNLTVGMYFFVHALKKTEESCTWDSSGTSLTCTGSDNEYHYAKYWYKITGISSNVITSNSVVDISDLSVIPGTDVVEIVAVKPHTAWCGDLRATEVIYRTFNSTEKTQYNYDGAAGVVEILPSEIVPTQFVTPLLPTTAQFPKSCTQFCGSGNIISCSCVSVYGEKMYKRIFVWNPFSSDIADNYNTGNTNVIYPQVETSSIDKSTPPQKVAGTVRYQFYTINDIVDGKPLIEVNYPTNGTIDSQNVMIKRIIDRSGMVGMPKKIQFLNKNGNVVFEGENEFKFSEDICDTAGTKPGAFYKSLSTRLSGDKALGLIEERTIRRETTNGVDFPYKSIADVVISRPFLTRVISKHTGVRSETKTGLFDALTGSPCVNVTQNITGNGVEQNKANIQVPYYLLLDRYVSQQNEDLQDLEEKNLFSLGGSGFVAELGIFSIPDNIQTIISAHNSDVNTASLKMAGSQKWKKNYEPSGSIPFRQVRFHLADNYKWTGGKFQWLTADTTNWLKIDNVTSVDRYTRPLMRVDAAGTPHCAIYHPYLNTVVGSIDNGRYEECAVFTCDYDDDLLLYSKDEQGNIIRNEDGYFDKQNGWEKGLGNTSNAGYIVRLDMQVKHFGNSTVYVEKAYGPTKNCKISAGKDYLFSAWVKVIQDTLKLVAEYRTGDAYGNLSSPSYFATKKIAPDSTKWQYVELKVPAKNLTSDNWYIRMWVGNDTRTVKAYVDDIRFSPVEAILSTFYYDQNLGLPVAVVDANNKAAYIKYDVFGRLVERGIIKDNP